MPIFTYCGGGGCPIKETCLRHSEHIEKDKDHHFSYAPYNHDRKMCGFFIGKNGDNILNQVDDILRNASKN